jgi:CRP/FNR family transcriptional regulator, anaerobic regulatory protein
MTALTFAAKLREGESVLNTAMARSSRLFAPKSVIIEEGDRPMYVFRVVAGRATRRRTLADGRSQLMSILLAGDIVGVRSLLDGMVTDTVEAITDVALQLVTHTDIHDLVDKNTSVALWLIWHASQEHLKIENWLKILTSGTALERIMFSLIDLWRRIPGTEGPVRLPISQRELAEHVGLTLGHVCRTVATLREAGLVEIHYGCIEILNINLLTESAKDIKHLLPSDVGGDRGI